MLSRGLCADVVAVPEVGDLSHAARYEHTLRTRRFRVLPSYFPPRPADAMWRGIELAKFFFRHSGWAAPDPSAWVTIPRTDGNGKHNERLTFREFFIAKTVERMIECAVRDAITAHDEIGGR